MNKSLLDKFFKDNTTVKSDKVASAPAMTHFEIRMEKHPDANTRLKERMGQAALQNQPERRAKVDAEKSEIESATDGGQIIRFMRRNIDPVNLHILVLKAMDFENEIVPEIVRMLKTSLNDNFIEMAVRVLARCETNITEDLIRCYDNIRNPYAQGMALVALGFRANEKYIPWFIEKYNELKKLYPKDSHCEGAYYALVEIENRFYPSVGFNKKT